MSIIGLLVALIIIGLLFWGVRTISAALAIPPLGGLSGGPILRLR